jgi:FkbM family methyltransferase
MFRTLLPYGLYRFLYYRHRFRQLGLSPNLSFSRRYRQFLSVTRADMLPRGIPLKYVVDVGANIGMWSVGITLIRQPELVIAFEPLPDIYQQLAANTRSFANIRTVNAAVGAAAGKVKLNRETQSEFSSVLPLHQSARAIHGLPSSETSHQVEVTLVTLDEALADLPEVSLLKLDVQGYESEVLKGAAKTLQRTQILMTEVMYFADYYPGALLCLELANAIAQVSPLRLWGISAPQCSSDGVPMWADAIFVAR